MSGTFRRRSKIETDLPAELREEVNRLLLEGATYEDVAMYCKARGFDISRSSVGRYGKAFFEAYQQVKQFEDQSKALKSEAGESLSMDEAISKMLQQRVLKGLMAEGFDIMEIPRLISDVAKLQTSNVLREKLKEDLRRQAVKETLDKLAKMTKENKGEMILNAKRIKELREQFL